MGGPGDRSWVKPVVVTAVVAACVVAAAAFMPKAVPFGRGEGRLEVVAADLPALADYLLVALFLLTVAAALLMRLRLVGEAGERRVKRRPVWAQLVSFGAILLLLWLITAVRTDGFLEPPAQSDGAPQQPSAEEPTASASTALGFLVTGVLTVALVAVGATVYLLGRRDEGGEGPEGPAADEVLEAVDEGIEALDQTSDPRGAVIECYRRMEMALTRAGAERLPSDTPFEFLDRALVRLDVPPRDARSLVALFERARFSPHPTTAGMREEARAALVSVQDSLRGARSAG